MRGESGWYHSGLAKSKLIGLVARGRKHEWTL
jgi:hypothetical protein